MSEFGAMQVMSLVVLSLINCTILAVYRPFLDKQQNKVELYNELTIYVCNTLMYCIMNTSSPDAFISFSGKALVFFSLGNVGSNLLLVIIQSAIGLF